MGGKENLRMFDAGQDREAARQNGRVGGLKSGEARRRRKEIREFLRDFLDSPASPTLRARMKEYGIRPEDQTNMGMMFLSVFLNAMNNGNVGAARQIFEWAGMEPLQAMREEAERARIAQTAAQSGKIEGQNSEAEEQDDVIIYRPEDAERLFSEVAESGKVNQARTLLKAAGLNSDKKENEKDEAKKTCNNRNSGRRL